MGYLYLGVTIILEALAILFMKQSDGMVVKLWAILGGGFYLAAFFTLTLALKTLPMGNTNAIWAGGSTVLVYIIGYYWLGEKVSLLEMGFVGMIIIGIVGLQLVGRG